MDATGAMGAAGAAGGAGGGVGIGTGTGWSFGAALVSGFCGRFAGNRTAVARYGASLSGVPFSAYATLRASVSVTSGAPVSRTTVPADGVCSETVSAA